MLAQCNKRLSPEVADILQDMQYSKWNIHLVIHVGMRSLSRGTDVHSSHGLYFYFTHVGHHLMLVKDTNIVF